MNLFLIIIFLVYFSKKRMPVRACLLRAGHFTLTLIIIINKEVLSSFTSRLALHL